MLALQAPLSFHKSSSCLKTTIKNTSGQKQPLWNLYTWDPCDISTMVPGATAQDGPDMSAEESSSKERRILWAKSGAGSPGFILHKQLFSSSLRSLKSSESLPASQCRPVFSDPCMQAPQWNKKHKAFLCIYCMHWWHTARIGMYTFIITNPDECKPFQNGLTAYVLCLNEGQFLWLLLVPVLCFSFFIAQNHHCDQTGHEWHSSQHHSHCTREIVPSKQSQVGAPQCLPKPLYPPGAQSAAWHSTHHL